LTKPLHFTENGIARAVAGARKAGLKPTAITIGPDGAITLYESLDVPKPAEQDLPTSKWADA
jgi:hypothetical protein